MRSERAIRSAHEFRRLYAEGRRTRRGCVTVFVAPSTRPDASPRLGLAVHTEPRRAVLRNRARRRLRAAFARCPEAIGFDIVVRADQRAARIPFEDLVRDLCDAVAEGAGR
ncbi:MAG: ribonuclease P protein component [Actinomycetota bacterium]